MEGNQERNCKSCSKEAVDVVNAQRFIARLDSFFAANDLKGAGEYLTFWESEAKRLGDDRGLLTVLNEIIGYSRRVNDKKRGLDAVETAEKLVYQLGIQDLPSGAVILINMATTLKAFGKPLDGLGYYERAEAVYRAAGLLNSYEYASLLNNRATALSELHRYDEAEKDMRHAIRILDTEGHHDGEIAVTLYNLAHLIFDRDDTAYAQVEETLDLAWEYINSPRQKHDANYAFILSKCAPSLRYFKREIEAEAAEAVAAEIYGGA